MKALDEYLGVGRVERKAPVISVIQQPLEKMEIKGVLSYTQRNNPQIADYLKFKSDFEVVMTIYKVTDKDMICYLLTALEGPVKKLLLEKKHVYKSYEKAKAMLRIEILGQNWVMK